MKRLLLISALLLVASNGWAEETLLKCIGTGSFKADEPYSHTISVLINSTNKTVSYGEKVLDYDEVGNQIISVYINDDPFMIETYRLDRLTGMLTIVIQVRYGEGPREIFSYTEDLCSKAEPLF